MRKFIAIIFLSLLCLATISAEVTLWDAGYELMTDGECGEKEKKDNKKEIKEFTASHEHLSTAAFFIAAHKILEDLIPPHHKPGKPTPPPDPAC